MLARVTAVLGICAFGASAGDWNPKAAAAYMDGRQKEWFAWKGANGGAKPCISCHTGMTYLMARPVLRKTLGETAPTEWETGLLNSLRERVAKTDPPNGAGIGVESVMAALFLRGESAAPAFDRMWTLQVKDGKSKGTWNWFNLNLDPWEMPESPFFGATLAAMAVGNGPEEYRTRPEVKDLVVYLRSKQGSQTLHNRVMLLWASAKLPDVLTAAERRAIIDEVWKRQSDGGWTAESLGPLGAHEKAPPHQGVDAYATAFVTYVMQQQDKGNAKLAAPLGWLRAHQDGAGYWDAASLNKTYPEGSMESRFMRDAATAFAVMALADSPAAR